MQAASVVKFWEKARQAGLSICIDGGWAVDAVLGMQTRVHNDLDIALPISEVVALRTLLALDGFQDVPRADSWDHNFVLQTGAGDTIDVHAYELHADGSNESGVPYRSEHLAGEGVIAGVRVRCVPPEWLVKFHTGYQIDATDWHDVRLLCAKFDLAIPDIFDRFAQAEFDK